MSGPHLYRAVDVSNWSGPITLETAAAWRAAGITRVIVRASIEDEPKRAIARQQLGIAQRARFSRQAYLWLYFWPKWTPEEQVESAREGIEGLGVSRLWIDCEEASPWEATTNVDRIRRAVAAAGDVPVGIYTSAVAWEQLTGNTSAFSDLPLWDADPDGIMRLDSFLRYGGWSARAVKQASHNVELGGVTVNLNVYRGGRS